MIKFLKNALHNLLSASYPQSKMLAALLLLVAVALSFAPFLFQGTVAYNTYTKICIFIVLVASYDMLIGYTRIVSFAHTMFYGIGAYAMAITLKQLGPQWSSVMVGLSLGLIVALLAALLIAVFSLRVQAVFFSMVTLAIASAFAILISKLYTITGGEDGMIIRTPQEIGPAFKLVAEKVLGFDVIQFIAAASIDPSNVERHFEAAFFKFYFNGKTVLYYGIFTLSTLLFLLMLRWMNSPFGRVLQAIRENEFRAQALGFSTVYYRTLNVCLSALVAATAGAMTALQLKYVSPDVTLSFTIMVNILLMVVIGGMGTLYGAVLGVSLFVLAETYLQDLMAVVYSKLGEDFVWAGLFNPDRWLLWLGVLFILSVYFIPRGIVGELRYRAEGRRIKAAGLVKDDQL